MERIALMRTAELVDEIIRLKKEKDAVLLVHNYQMGEIQEIADYLGDSLGLARQAAKSDHSLIVFCGVKFMAETAKILSPGKKVLLPRTEATCPMAEMVDPVALKELKESYPDAQVVTYVNSTAEVKAESDVCCTSANAVNVVSNVESDTIIFTPDRNLASYVQRFTDKKIILWDGFCYVHNRFNAEDVRRAKEARPDALLMVHPECPPPVIDLADEVLSTSGMVRMARDSDRESFLVGTEEGMLYRLKKENPGKEFYSAGPARVCTGMKSTRLVDVYAALTEEKYEMIFPQDIMDRARTSLEKMLIYV